MQLMIKTVISFRAIYFKTFSSPSSVVRQLGNARSVGEIREHCLQQFNTSDYVQSFKVAADTSDVATLTALCQICHILMTDHKLHVPRNR